MHSKDLLRFEKDYVTGVFNEERDGNIKNFYLNKLLTQTPKPMMSQQSSDLMARVREFLPEMDKANKTLLSNPTLIKEKQIDKQEKKHISQLNIKEEYLPFVKRTGKNSKKKYVDMNLFMGVFDMKPKQPEQIEQKQVRNIIEEIL